MQIKIELTRNVFNMILDYGILKYFFQKNQTILNSFNIGGIKRFFKRRP